MTREDTTGIVLAATGETFRDMAIKAARSIAQHCPGLPVDLYTDAPLQDPVFAQVHVLDATQAKMPKIAALKASRFDKTLFLDADILLVAPIWDVFELLGPFDLALAHDQWRNSGPAGRIWRKDLPAAYPQFNGGVIGFAKSERVSAFFDTWETAFFEHGIGKDQPSLRELLWEDRSLRVTVLPEEYNLWDLKRIDRLSFRHTSPRVLHSNLMKRPRVLSSKGREVPLILGRSRAAKLQMHLDLDATLDPSRPRETDAPRTTRWRIKLARFEDVPRKVMHLLRRPFP